MKKLTVTLCMMLVLAMQAIAQTPSLAETQAWITEKLKIDAGYTRKEKVSQTPNSATSTTTVKTESVEFDGCNFFYTDILKTDIAGNIVTTLTMKHVVKLSDFDADRITVEKDKNGYRVNLPTNNDAKVIKADALITMMGNRQNISEKVAVCAIWFEDEALANRVVKAFANAITLCKSKKRAVLKQRSPMKRIIIALYLILLLASLTLGQKKKPAPAKKNFTTSPTPPALPTEAGINYHRMKDKVLYLAIKNTGTKPIKSVRCSILVIDVVTMKEIASFGSVNFEYAVDVSPKESFTAILDESKIPKLKNDNIALGKCADYKYAKEIYIPNRCTQDAFTISISSIIFSDGTEWVQPKVAEILERSSRPSPKNPTPYEQPSFKLSQLKQRKITKQEFGELWVFIPNEGILACNTSGEERLYFLDGAKSYPLNGWALDTKIEGVKVLNLGDIVSNDKGLQPFLKIASSLCK